MTARLYDELATPCRCVYPHICSCDKPRPAPICIANATRGRGGEYTADLLRDGVRVGRIERSLNQGGMRQREYRAHINGRLIASGRTLAELREELHDA